MGNLIGCSNNAGTVKLGLLDLLQTEYDVIRCSIALSTATLIRDQLELLNRQLCRLLQDLQSP
jgi:hypothetical protein